MGNIFRYSMLLGKRWIWMLLVGALLSGSATYLISTFLRPVYQASAYLIVDIGAVAHPNITESLQAVPTFAQLIKTPAVLDPVVALHPGMTLQELASFISVKPQTNTQIIELDAQASNPRFAAELANQVSQSFAQYTSNSSSGTVRIIPAQEPSLPTQPRPLEEAAIGTVVGLFLMLILASLFEWLGNRATSVEQIQELLETEIMTLMPRFPRRSRQTDMQQSIADKYHMICASLNVSQANRLYKLVMFTSPLAGEGKSTVVSHVAIHLAQAGKQILLIDLNVHRPMLAQLFHLSNQTGLTNLLVGKGRRLQLERYSQATDIPGLRVLTAGSQSMNSSELLQSLIATQFFSQLQQTAFDYILFDAPPLFAVAETRILASSIESVVLVVNGSRTPRRVLESTRQILQRAQTTRLLGVVINQSSWRDYADMHPYTPPAPQSERELSSVVEQITVELPVITTMLLPTSSPGTPSSRLPDTGETEQVGIRKTEYIIRPSLSLGGLTAPHNGLTRRAFSQGTSSDTPQSLQNG